MDPAPLPERERAGRGGRVIASDRIFRNRRQAGELLGQALSSYVSRKDVVVVGLPRGGVPVAAEVARSLDAPLDVLIVRKLGAPGQEELAIGAIAEGGVRVFNRGLLADLALDREAIDAAVEREERELQRRVKYYRSGRAALPVENRTVILVDDGVATGATMRAGLQALRARGAARIIAAAPVGSADSVESLRKDADEVVVLETPAWFQAVGQWYEDFGQTSDEEVRACLATPGEQA